MSYFDWGNSPISSTTPQPDSTASSAVLTALLSSTDLGTDAANWPAGKQQNFRVTWNVGGTSTVAQWKLQHTTSSTIADAPINEVYVVTATGQSAQFVHTFRLQQGSRLQAHLASSITGTLAAFIQAEPLT